MLAPRRSRRRLRPVIVLLLTLVSAGTPNLAQLDAQEALNDALEARFDGLCRALKASGVRRLRRTSTRRPSSSRSSCAG